VAALCVTVTLGVADGWVIIMDQVALTVTFVVTLAPTLASWVLLALKQVSQCVVVTVQLASQVQHLLLEHSKLLR
jgi:hypothetical protein